MAALFRRKKKLPQPKDVLKALEEVLALTTAPDVDHDALNELAQTTFESLKSLICGNDDEEETAAASPQNVEMVTELLEHSALLLRTVNALTALSLENRKRFAYVFCALAAKTIGGTSVVVEYWLRPDTFALLETLTRCQFSSPLALVSGQMLRATLVAKPVARALLNSATLFDYFDAVRLGEFDVATAAWTSFKAILTFGLTPETKHRGETCVLDEYLDHSLDAFMPLLLANLDEAHYIATRQTLTLLTELISLCSGAWVPRFLASAPALQRLLVLLNAEAKSVKLAAFQLFKFFVGEEAMSREIAALLARNREELIAFLPAFLPDNETPQFVADRETVVSLLRAVREPAPVSARPRAASGSTAEPRKRRKAKRADKASEPRAADTDSEPTTAEAHRASSTGEHGREATEPHRASVGASAPRDESSDDSSYWLSSDDE